MKNLQQLSQIKCVGITVRWLASLLLSVTTITPLCAQEANDRILYEHPAQLKISKAKEVDSPGRETITFPAIKPINGYRACLAFDACLYMNKPGGFNPYLSMILNGKPITQYIPGGETRLLRRGEYFEMNAGPNEKLRRNWWQGDVLLAFFGDGKVLDHRVLGDARKEGYYYLLDVDDLVNKVKIGPDFHVLEDKENKLVLRNHLLDKYSQVESLRIDNFKVIYVPVEKVESFRSGGKDLRWKAAPAVATLKGTDFAAEVTGGGDLVLKTPDGNYYFYVEFSYPASPEMKFNRLNPEKADGVVGWNPKITPVSPTSATVTASSTDYTLERKISIDGDKIVVHDKISNTSKRDIACVVRYGVSIDRRLYAKKLYLGGMPGASIALSSAENPSVFFGSDKGSLGILVEDNVMRLQMSMSKQGNSVMMETVNFGLPAGESHVFERSIYPLKTKEYLDFVNYIRDQHKINFTNVGPLCFNLNEPAVKKLHVKYVPVGWFEWWDGLQFNRQQFKEFAHKKTQEERSRRPGIKTLASLETNMIMIDRAKVDFGTLFDKLEPYENASYNNCKIFTREQTEFLLNLDCFKKFADSFHYSEDKRLIGYWGSLGKMDYLQLCTTPAEGNYRLENILEQCDFLLDDVGLDGIYMDQLELGGATGGRLLIDTTSFDRWDKRSVIIAKDGTIASRFWNSTLAGATAIRRIIEHVLSKGKFFNANTQPCVKETSLLPVLRYTEQENNDISSFITGTDKPPVSTHGAKCHFSPISQQWGLRADRYVKNDPREHDRILTRGIVFSLRNATLFRIYGHPSNKYGGCVELLNRMYPFTPVELNEGFLIGKERIISCVSRPFNIKSAGEPKCFAVDQYGQPKQDPGFKAVKTTDGWTVDVKLNDWNEVAVIEL